MFVESEELEATRAWWISPSNRARMRKFIKNIDFLPHFRSLTGRPSHARNVFTWSYTYVEPMICSHSVLNFKSRKQPQLGKSSLLVGPKSENMPKLPKTRKLAPTWWVYCEPTTHPQTFIFSVFGLCVNTFKYSNPEVVILPLNCVVGRRNL